MSPLPLPHTHTLLLNDVYKHTHMHTPLQVPADKTLLSRGLRRDVLSKGVIKKSE